MFGLGMTELILIAAVVLIVVGPKRLPDIAKSLGKGYGEFKKSFSDFKESVNLNDTVEKEKPKSENVAEQYIDKYKSAWETKIPADNKKVETIPLAPATKIDNIKTNSPKSDKKKA